MICSTLEDLNKTTILKLKHLKIKVMSNLSCPKCGELTKRGGYKAWQIIVAVCLFPIGLLALLADRNPTTCQKCGHTWNG